MRSGCIVGDGRSIVPTSFFLVCDVFQLYVCGVPMTLFLARFSGSLASVLAARLSGGSIALLSAAVLAGGINPSALAQGPSPVKGPKPKADRLTIFVPPPGKKGAPLSTASTATRDRQSCRPGGEPLKLTWSEVQPARPQFSLYLPNTAARQVVFALRGPGFYERQVVPLPSGSGWVKLAWPEQSSPLAIGQRYEWFVVVVCGASPEPDDPTFTGGFDPKSRSIVPVP